jgi:PAS domain S-box-containing protein
MPFRFRNIKKRKIRSASLRIALIYLLIGFAWIFFSDRLVQKLFESPADVQTYKGFFFVIATAVLIYLLMFESISKIFKIEKLNESILSKFPGIFLIISKRNYLEYFNENAYLWLGLDSNYRDKLIDKISESSKSGAEIFKRFSDWKQGKNFEINSIQIEFDNEIKYINLQFFKIELYESNEVRFLIIGFDVSASYLFDKKIKENEKRYFELFAKAGIAMVLLDKNGKVIEVNQKALSNLNIDANDLLNKSLDEVLPNHVNEHYLENFKHVVKSGKSLVKEEFNLVDKYFITTYQPLFDKEGQLQYIQIISQDITEQKSAEQKLQNLNLTLEEKVHERTQRLLEALNAIELKQEQLLKLNDELIQVNSKLFKANDDLNSFAHSVSHDLKAPLRSINGFTEMLQQKYKTQLGVDGNRIFEKILRNSNKMGALINDLLSFAKFGKEVVNPMPVNMDEIVEQILADLKEDDTIKDFEIVKSKLGIAICDKNLIKQVWINLLSNAIKYSKHSENKRIEIGLKNIEEKKFFYIKDNGCGFDMRYADKLFKVFQRLHHSSDFEGSGVGLAIVERIIANHGGKIFAESIKDKGATFYFCI